LSQPSGRSGSYTGLIGFNPLRLKGLKRDELPRNGPSVYAKYSSLCRLLCRIWLLLEVKRHGHRLEMLKIGSLGYPFLIWRAWLVP